METKVSSRSLGFIPQKEIVYNKLLPYSHRLDEQSRTELAEIKANLPRSVLLRDLRPGTLHWVVRLCRYIQLYGRKFSKEDHIYFIKLLFDLITIPELEPTLIEKFGYLLIVLLKKKELILRDDLELPWRPLYNQYKWLLFSSYAVSGMILLPNGFDRIFKNVIHCCRVYFSLDSTQEMLDEWRPLMCPYDATMSKAINFFENFLPTNLAPEYHSKGFKLWFEEFISIWKATHNSPSWETKVIRLFSRLATDNIGYIDWDPYIPMIFTRLLRSFNLPVGWIRQIRSGLAVFQHDVTEKWIVAMMGKSKLCQEHLNDLFKALKSYYHPSNSGRWIINLYDMLSKLPAVVVKRIHRERHEQNTWMTKIPDSHKLSDDDLTSFVESVKPCVMLAMFSKVGSNDAANAIQNLAILRPRLVIPTLLEKLYPALETLTEPHRLMATMNCIVSVGRILVRGGLEFPEGQSHVVPLLMLTLPGIDPNDIKKCMVTFQFISTFSTLIQLVDCSDAVNCRDDLTEVEREVCISTAQFEDFVLEFMDRCFTLIQNSVLEHTTRTDIYTAKMNVEEGMLEIGLSSTFTAILAQCSTPIFKSALKKLKNFISGRVLETKVAGKYAANMVRSTIRINPMLGFKAFLPSVCKMIMNLTSSEDVLTEENLDDELMFNLLLLGEILKCDGNYTLDYKEEIREVFNRILKITSRQGLRLVTTAVANILDRITSTYPVENCNINLCASKPLSEYLPIRDWGKPGDINNLNIKWYMPGKQEVEWATEIVRMILAPTLDELDRFSDKQATFTRDELLHRLVKVQSVLVGSSSLLPLWKEEPIKLTESSTQMIPKPPIVSVNDEVITLEDDQNVRSSVRKAMNKLLAHMMENCEDDTYSLCNIIHIYQHILFSWGTNSKDFEKRYSGYRMVKKALRNKLAGKKRHIRALLVDRALLHHEAHNLQRINYPFTAQCQSIMDDFITLATSHYSEIRVKSQIALAESFKCFPYSYVVFVPRLVELLKKDPTLYHEEFKGTLHILYHRKERALLVRNDWKLLGSLWPSILNSKHSEKPSIINLLDNISDCVLKHFVTFSIESKVPQSCLDVASAAWDLKSLPRPSSNKPSNSELLDGEQSEIKNNQNNLRCYHQLIDDITKTMKIGNLHWRHLDVATHMLYILIRFDLDLPTNAVSLFVDLLVNDRLTVRKVAMVAVRMILKRQKPKCKMIASDLPNVVNDGSIDSNHLVFGHRQDNLWLLYDSNSTPTTKEAFERSTFVHQTHWGYYTWPKNFQVYAKDQSYFSAKLGEMPDNVEAIHSKFSKKEFIDKLFNYLSLEEKKGKDRFDVKKYYMFKGIFKNFRCEFLPHLKEYLHDYVSSSSENKQRCAAEIISGMLRGSKHWNFEEMVELREFLTPVLKKAMDNISVETVQDWAMCIVTAIESRDPNKYHWLFELLLDDPLKDNNGSFVASSRLLMVQGALVQQEWRVPELLHKILNYLQPHLSDSYHNVRENIASVLTAVFMYDGCMENTDLKSCPRRADLMKNVMPVLEQLLGNHASNINDDDNDVTVNNFTNNHVADVHCDKERKTNISLLKTVCRWVCGIISRTPYTAPPEALNLLPLLCHFECDTTDDELKSMCATTLTMVGQAFLLPDNVNVALKAVHQVMKSNSWHARNAILNYLQISIFYNYFTFKSDASWVSAITDVVCGLLKDDQVEVRELASVTLSGLFQCKFIEISDDMLNDFKKTCRGRTPKGLSTEKMIERHAGILGLCSCVNAYPYDVPQYIPDVLMLLGEHINDPQPILSTVKKTLSDFKRTHHDSWRDHKLKFSDDQLVVLTDLLVSPSYYA